MKKILFIATGGTFACIKGKDGLKPKFSIKEFLKFFPEAEKMADIQGKQLFNLDSTNLSPKHWKEMAQVVYDNYSDYDGFIISHGTDTMPFSSAALSLALKDLSKPVVFTGSVFPAENPNSDARKNLLDSISVVVSNKVKEVCICFHGEIIKGTQARKATNEATKITNEKIGVYSSINCHLTGTVTSGKVIENQKYFSHNSHHKKTNLQLHSNFDQDIALIKIFPGQKGEVLKSFTDKKAIIIEAFAVGNIPFENNDYLEHIKKLTKKGIPVFVTTQNPFGEVDMDMYEVGQKAKRAGAVGCGNMTTETALVKLMWILGNFSVQKEEVEELMLRSFCGEVFGV